MTWSVTITKGNTGEQANCYKDCKHGKPDEVTGMPPCYVLRASQPIGYLLTSVDRGADGYMACGTADLKCFNFEPNDSAEGA